MNEQNRKIGLFLVITGAIFWGIGGTVSKKLFQEYSIDVNWLVVIRLLIAGLLLLSLKCVTKNRGEVFKVWKDKKVALHLIIFGIFGMLGVQYTYMVAIDYGNAATATLLQYLSPVMIIVYLLLRKRIVFTLSDMITVLLALLGSFLLLTNGSLSQMYVPIPAIVWGVLSGVAAAFYTLYAAPLLKKYDSLVVVGWAMVIGGVALNFIHPLWAAAWTSFTLKTYLYLAFVIVFGTMIAFWFYIKSLQSLSPKETSLLGSLEPLAAVITTVFWLKAPFGTFQWLGACCIIGVVFILAFWSKKPAKLKKGQKNVSSKIS
ncbi:DMT family transporter [Priestia filamentosa]|uniref:Transporter n=2 Tax=Priestia filamentosa TaxID=1402861 RepID=A0A1X7EL45_9BACI|nr:DMT family transporter [Priestia filamentosa]AKO93093.1 transporter [Priestia filamentosa]MDT3763218.1 DMT family transporter [Priestia filamentosa]OXS69726.1 EamA family transporter [Priestia filamentosa]RJS63613.1 EamA family transporter [Priestia filamentosa]WRU93692.1 DMT family transporter [Priestia filamentosa]